MGWATYGGFWRLAALLGAGALLAACGGARVADTGDAASPGDGGSFAVPDCGAPDAALAGYATEASGSVAGPEVSASICNAAAYLFLSRYSQPPGDYLLFLNSSAGAIAVAQPAMASDGQLTGMMAVSAPAPGVYASSGACGFLSFSLYLPAPAGLDCGTGTGPNCPPGCEAACSGFGCEPCTPTLPEVGYGATGTSDCLGMSSPVTGSWTVTLTSVVPFMDDAGSNQNGQHFTTHGTVTGMLPNQDGGTDTATITMAF